MAGAVQVAVAGAVQVAVALAVQVLQEVVHVLPAPRRPREGMVLRAAVSTVHLRVL
jgi:hypothetical protein